MHGFLIQRLNQRGHHSRDVLKVYLPLVPSKMKVCALDFKGIEIRSGVYK